MREEIKLNRLLILLFLIYNTGCVNKEIKLSKKLLIECRVESSSKSILLNNLFKDLKFLERKNKSNLLNIKNARLRKINRHYTHNMLSSKDNITTIYCEIQSFKLFKHKANQ